MPRLPYYQSKKCVRCEERYTPTSSRQLYCPPCAMAVRAEACVEYRANISERGEDLRRSFVFDRATWRYIPVNPSIVEHPLKRDNYDEIYPWDVQREKRRTPSVTHSTTI